MSVGYHLIVYIISSKRENIIVEVEVETKKIKKKYNEILKDTELKKKTQTVSN